MGVGVVGGTSQLEGIYNAVTNAPKPAIVDPLLQPAFYLTSQQYPSGSLVYNHYLQVIGSTTQGDDSYSTNGWSNSYGTEFNNNYGYSNGNPSTGAGLQVTAGVGHSNYFGHRYFEVNTSPSANSDMKIHTRGNSGSQRNYAGWYYLGSIVSDNTSNAHSVVIGIDTSNQLVLTRNSYKIFGEAFEQASVSVGQSKASLSTLFNAYSLGSVSAGISYNATTKKLVLLGRNGYSHYPIVVSNVDHPAGYINNAQGWVTHILAQSRIANTSSPSYTPWNTNESQYRAQVTITDTDRIYTFKMYTNTGYSSSYWDISNGAIGSSVTLQSRSYTTVYGITDDAANGGGSQYNITNDTRYIFMYTHNYYYHGGFYGMVIDTKTGRCIHNYYWETSTVAGISPVGKSMFILGYANNADSGAGYYSRLFKFDEEYYAYAGNAGTTNSLVAPNTSPFNTATTQWLDTPYHSTNYPSVFQVTGFDRALVGGQK